jgi:large subunit ribosomal protein L19
MSNLMQTFVYEPNPNIPALRPGDMVRVHNRIVEGDQERVQVFQGTVMRMYGSGAKARFTVRRIASHGVGVERTFFLISPRLEKVEVLRSSHVRQAQLYYLRERRGKAARLRGKKFLRGGLSEGAAAPAAEPAAAETTGEQ